MRMLNKRISQLKPGINKKQESNTTNFVLPRNLTSGCIPKYLAIFLLLSLWNALPSVFANVIIDDSLSHPSGSCQEISENNRNLIVELASGNGVTWSLVPSGDTSIIFQTGSQATIVIGDNPNTYTLTADDGFDDDFITIVIGESARIISFIDEIDNDSYDSDSDPLVTNIIDLAQDINNDTLTAEAVRDNLLALDLLDNDEPDLGTFDSLETDHRGWLHLQPIAIFNSQGNVICSQLIQEEKSQGFTPEPFIDVEDIPLLLGLIGDFFEGLFTEEDCPEEVWDSPILGEDSPITDTNPEIDLSQPDLVTWTWHHPMRIKGDVRAGLECRLDLDTGQTPYVWQRIEYTINNMGESKVVYSGSEFPSHFAFFDDMNVGEHRQKNLARSLFVGATEINGGQFYTEVQCAGTNPTVRFSPSGGIRPDITFTAEFNGSVELDLELDVPGGGSILKPVSVQVEDITPIETNNATGGVDYGILGPSPTVTFPAGASDGSTQPFTVNIFEDFKEENNEVIELSLNAVDCVTIGSFRFEHTIIIEDNDAPSNGLPVATDNDYSTDENVTFNGNVITDDTGNGIDSDPEMDSLTVSKVQAGAANVDTQITLASGALLTVNDTGSFTYDPNGAFDASNEGETDTDTFEYTVSDGNGGSDSATVTITINGVNQSGGNGLVGHWKLDESSGMTAPDSSGAGSDGSLVGTPSWEPANGIIDGALHFSGITDRIDLPNDVLDGATDVTASLWFKTSFAGVQSLISGANSGNNNEYLLIFGDNTTIRFAPGENVHSIIDFQGLPAFNDDLWHHLVLVRDNTANMVSLYMDGALQSSKISPLNALNISPNGLMIGQEQDCVGDTCLDPEQRFRGSLDDIRIYDRVLLEEDVLSIYNAAVQGLTAHWKLDESEGASVPDSSGMGLNGSLVGDPSWEPASGIIGGALNFSESSDRIDLPNTVLDAAMDVTASLWFKTSFAGQQSLISGANSGNHNEYLLFFEGSTTVRFATGENTSSIIDFQGLPAFNDGQWHHLALVRDNTRNEVSLYMDGVLRSSVPATLNTLSIPPTGLMIAQKQYCVAGCLNADQRFRGSLDDIRIYHRVLSQEEVLDIHDIGQRLAAHWKLDENGGPIAPDSSGSGLNGSLVGTPSWEPANGIIDGALHFSGTTDRIDLPNDVLDGATDVTASLWFKTSFAGVQSLISGANSGNNNEYLLIFVDNTTIRFAPGENAHSIIDFQGLPTFNDDQWHHLALVRDNTANMVSLYMDGVLQATTNTTLNSLNIPVTGLMIAQEQDCLAGCLDANQRFRGSLDDIRIYQRTLSAQEILALYNTAL